MKFSSATGRNALREQQRRDRATAPVLRNAYPQFASLRLEFDFSEPETSAPAPQVLVLHPPSQAYFVFSCPYADCDGEFDLTTTIAALRALGRSELRGSSALRRAAGTRSSRPHALPAHARLLHRTSGAEAVRRLSRARPKAAISPISSFQISGCAAM